MAHLGNHQFARDLEDAMPAPGPFYRKATCLHCDEPIKLDGEYGWVHIANPQFDSWYAYCEMNRNHADHTTSGKLTAAEPAER